MKDQPLQRRLAAILVTDVAGYSRLMGADEARTHIRLRELRKDFIDPCVTAHEGHVVKLTGDGALIEFTSVVAALECAIEIQRGLAERNADAPLHERLDFRIGINLGEIILDDADIYGEGVNVAARLQMLAEPGGICVSGLVYSQVKNKIDDIDFVYLGEQKAKNIAEPVPAYRVVMDRIGPRPPRIGRRIPAWAWRGAMLASLVGVAAAATWFLQDYIAEFGGEAPLSLDRYPSIAVLPFDDLSQRSDQQYFVDGITEELITGLAKFPDLFVIARNSTFKYKGVAVDVRQVGRELGVRYLVEGSAQRSNGDVRVTAQLIDVSAGHHVWAENYDRPVAGIFEIRDDITRSIAGALMGTGGVLADAEVERVSRKDPAGFTAYDYLMQGWYESNKFTRQGNQAARALFNKSREADPNYARAYAALAWTYAYEYDFEWTENFEETVATAMRLALKAVELDDGDYRSHWALGWAHLYSWEHDKAAASYARARQLNPNDAELLAEMANLLIYLGRPDQAVEQLQEAIRLNPFREKWYDEYLAWALEEAGRPLEAIPVLERVIDPNPTKEQLWLLRTLAAAYAHPAVNRMDDARSVTEKILALDSTFSISAHEKYVEETFPYQSQERIDRWIAALRRTGLPD